jgi:hypothetical protein
MNPVIYRWPQGVRLRPLSLLCAITMMVLCLVLALGKFLIAIVPVQGVNAGLRGGTAAAGDPFGSAAPFPRPATGSSGTAAALSITPSPSHPRHVRSISMWLYSSRIVPLPLHSWQIRTPSSRPACRPASPSTTDAVSPAGKMEARASLDKGGEPFETRMWWDLLDPLRSCASGAYFSHNLAASVTAAACALAMAEAAPARRCHDRGTRLTA